MLPIAVFHRLQLFQTTPMSQITPVPPESPPDFVPADGPDEAAPETRAGQLWLLIVIPIIYGIFTLGAWSSSHAPQPPPTGPYENTSSGRLSKILVHVAGAVRHPGVYEMPGEARVNDAVKRAVPLPDADVNALNLAAWAEDGSRIEVPLKVKEARASEPREPLITRARRPDEPRETPKAMERPTAKPTPAKARAKTLAKTVATPPHKININRATLDDLILLPNVGPELAERILDYRKANGTFSSVDELDEVRGIGPKTLEKIRPWRR